MFAALGVISRGCGDAGRSGSAASRESVGFGLVGVTAAVMADDLAAGAIS
jgi:hypothetical protein